MDLTTLVPTKATHQADIAAAKDRANHTGTQPASTVIGLAQVAVSGAWADLSGKPTIPTTPAQVGAEPAGLSAATQSTISAQITTAVAGVVAGAPAALDTLIEIASQLASDESAAAALAATVAGKASTVALTAETTRATAAEGLAAQKSANLSDLGSTTQARTNLGLGSAATQPSTAFDAAGAAGTAQTAAAFDATSKANSAQSAAIAAAATDATTKANSAQSSAIAVSAQRAANLSDLASASAARTNLGLDTAATQPATAFDAAGAAAAAQVSAASDATAKVNALSGRTVPTWQPNTAYMAGTVVLSPAGFLVQAVAGFTSGGSFVAANWTQLSVDPASVAATYATKARTGAQAVGQGEITINLKDYTGVLGDGTDQTAALTAALTDVASKAAASNGQGIQVIFPPGDYVSGPLSLTAANITVDGYGATLTSTNSSGSTTPALTVTGSRVRVRGLRIRHATPCDPLTDVKSNYAHGLDIRGGTGPTNIGRFVRVQDVNVEGAWYHGIQARFTRGVAVSNCDIDTVLATGLCVYDVIAAVIQGNRINNSRDDNMFISSDTAFGQQCEQVTIVANQCSNSQEKGIGTSGVLGCTITGNNIYNTYVGGIQVLQDTTFGQGASQVVSITGNTVRNAGKNFNNGSNPKHPTASTIGNGIYVAAGTDRVVVTGNDIHNANLIGIAVVGNTTAGDVMSVAVNTNLVTTCGSQGISVGSGAAADAINVRDFTIVGNILRDIANHGILIQKASYGVISDNVVRSWGTSGTGTNRPIYVNAAQHTDVHGNLAYNDSGATGATTAVLLSGCVNSREWGNRQINPGDDNSFTGLNIGFKLLSGTAAPTTGTWKVGDLTLNSNPTTSTAVLGWRCITAGTPGTWQPIPLTASLTGAVAQRTVAGSYISATGTGSTTATPAIGRLFLTPIAITNAVTAVTLNVRTTANGETGSVIRLGLYADDGTTNPTGAPLAEGTVAGDGGAATKTLTINVALPPGTYWTAAVVQSATTTAPTLNAYNSRLPGLPADANPVTNVSALFKDSVTGALPSSPSGLGVQTSAPIVTVGI